MAADSTSPTQPVMEAVAVIVDCNCFLQLRDLSDLPWREMFPGVKRIEIMVTPSVVSELDRKKVDPKDRIRNRARAAFRMLDEASEADPMRMVLREVPVLVALNLPEVPRTDWAAHPRLDPSRPDDALVVQAVDLATELPKTLLSHDGGPRLIARRLGLKAKSVPDAWLLPDTVDDDRKQIQKLQRENELLKARHPQIRAGWGSADKPLERLTIERLVVRPLSVPAIEAAVARCRDRWPHAIGTLRAGLGFFIGDDDTSGRFDQDDYHRYFIQWQEWANGLRPFFEKLPHRIAAATRFGAAAMWFENTGTATADRLTIDFAVSEGWRVLPDRKAVDEVAAILVKLPARPRTPFQQHQSDQLRKVEDASRHIRLSIPAPTTPRDPTGFYWINRPGRESDRGVYECKEFRAKRRHDDEIWLWPFDSPPAVGNLTVDVHGTNLSEPLKLELPLDFVDREVHWDDEHLLGALEPDLAEIIAEVTTMEGSAY